MKGSKRENLLLAGLFGLAGIFLIISCHKVMVTGPLSLVLKEASSRTMMAEVGAVFIWNLLWLKGRGKAWVRCLGLAAGIVVFTWCHRIFLPGAVSFLYLAGLMLWGRWLHRLISLELKECTILEMSLSLVTGSGFWIVFVCLISLTGHGGIRLWRWCALIMGAAALLAEGALFVRRRRRMPAQWERSPRSCRSVFLGWMPERRSHAWLLAFIITMVLIQAGRLNIELDYDSLHYGLRSAYVLDNGRGIYENLGMINLVYTYSKGLEVLVLPLCGTPTYGFVLAFSLWIAVAVLALGASMVSRVKGRGMGLFAAAVLSSIPGIMNMAATAKSDIITLLHQLIIYYFLCQAFETGKKDEKGPGRQSGTPWLLMAIGTYLLTMVYKPTALVFSTALGGVALLCLILTGRLTLGDKRGWLLLVFPAGAVAGLWYRTWLLTGVPVTSIFAGFCEKIGWAVKYPFTFRHVIGDASLLTVEEKLARLGRRLGEMLLAPVSEDMDHVIIAWGTCLVTLFLFIWIWSAVKSRDRRTPRVFFDLVLVPVMALGCIASIYTLSQVDGNYFILFYALVVISSMRMAGGIGEAGVEKAGIEEAGAGKAGRLCCLTVILFMVCNVPITCLTSWAGNPGFTPISLKHRGYYDHRREALVRRREKGYQALAGSFTPRTRVVAFGTHPDVLELPCSVQSYYDVTGSGGNVYLVKRLAYFEEFLEYAGTEYFFVEAGYLAGQPRALEMIEDMIEEGSLTDIRYEWGNMTARVTLDGAAPEHPEQAVEEFYQNYSMERVTAHMTHP